MDEKKLNELVARASKGELTADNINEVVIAFAAREVKQDTEIRNLKVSSAQHGRSLQDIEEEYPLLPPEADDLSKLVRRVGVRVLGGKKSAAYADTALRSKVYKDIYGEVKRQYGLEDASGRKQSYKKLKRKHLNGAMDIVSNYIPPIAISNEIEEVNDLGEMMD